MSELLIGISGLKIAEVTSWGSSSRIRFVGIDKEGVEIKFDLPVSGLKINIPYSGPFSVLVTQETPEEQAEPEGWWLS